jgi:hypothetical protein
MGTRGHFNVTLCKVASNDKCHRLTRNGPNDIGNFSASTSSQRVVLLRISSDGLDGEAGVTNTRSHSPHS